MTVAVAPFQTTDLQWADGEFTPLLGVCDMGWDDYVLTAAAIGPCRTFRTDEPFNVVAFAGIMRVHTGVGEVWIMPSVGFQRYAKAFVRLARQEFSEQAEVMGLWRCQCIVDAGNKRALKFAISEGFQPEGLHRMQGPQKQDMVMLGRLFMED